MLVCTVTPQCRPTPIGPNAKPRLLVRRAPLRSCILVRCSRHAAMPRGIHGSYHHRHHHGERKLQRKRKLVAARGHPASTSPGAECRTASLHQPRRQRKSDGRAGCVVGKGLRLGRMCSVSRQLSAGGWWLPVSCAEGSMQLDCVFRVTCAGGRAPFSFSGQEVRRRIFIPTICQ